MKRKGKPWNYCLFGIGLFVILFARSSSGHGNYTDDEDDDESDGGDVNSRLSELIDEANRLNEYNGNSVGYACPGSCSCVGSLVDCSRRKLTRVPSDLPVGVEILDLSRNQIAHLVPGVFNGLPNLKRLDVGHNRLRRLNSSLFLLQHRKLAHLPHPLEDLRLDNNQLSHFPLFDGLTRLKVLILSHNHIQNIANVNTNPTTSLPLYSNLKQLDLSYNRIGNLTSDSFANVTSSRLKTLLLNNNRLANLPKNLFNVFVSLEQLKLSKNRIQTVAKESFNKLTNLKELDLNKNRIKQIEGLTFHGLESLRVLKLRRNGLINLDDGAFWGLNSIVKLLLDHNNLTDVKKGWLYGLTTLLHLNISHNNISNVDGDGWEFCHKIEELDLSYNTLHSITKDMLVKLNNVLYLVMDHNSISFIEEESFKMLSALKVMELNYNEISWTIEDTSGPFVGLEKLSHLGLAWNKIKSIARRAFVGLTRLRTLDLTANPIASIQDQAFSPFKSLQELRLNSSQLVCDCTLKWLVVWLHGASKLRDHNSLKRAKCKHPIFLTNRNLLDANADDLRCDDFTRPYIIEEPKTQIALKGSNVSLTCKAVSNMTAQNSSVMTFQWRKDNKILNLVDSKNSEITIATLLNGSITEYKNTLNIMEVEYEDEGRYQCIVTNAYGTVYSQKGRITVHIMPNFTKFPSNVTVKAGNTARLECAATGQPDPEIAWKKDGGDDFPAARERRMIVMPADHVFFIVEVKALDMGIYSCTAVNPAGTVMANASLTVLETPTFVRPMHNKTARRGETAVLECMSSGSPKPELTWTKDSGNLIPTERHFFTADNQLLIIVKTDTSDAGEYTCQMSNILGTIKQSSNLTIIDDTPAGTNVEETSSTTSRSRFSAWLHDDNRTRGIIIIAIVCCIVITSFVWVIIIVIVRNQTSAAYSAPL